MDPSQLSDVQIRSTDKVESLEDVARILSMRKTKLAFGNFDLDAIKPYIACAALLVGISVSNTIPPYRF